MQRYRLAQIPCSFRFEAKPFLILMYDIERASLLGLDLTVVIVVLVLVLVLVAVIAYH